jgi:hypothetical protein
LIPGRACPDDEEGKSMIALDNRLRAGVEVPDTPIIDRAIGYAHEKCEP